MVAENATRFLQLVGLEQLLLARSHNSQQLLFQLLVPHLMLPEESNEHDVVRGGIDLELDLRGV